MNKAKINRRRFLILTSATLGSCVLSCAGLSVLFSTEDRPDISLPIGFPEFTIAGNHMPKKILIAYASTTGSTGGVAETIGKSLAETGIGVDVRPIQSVTHLDDYAAVVLGSPINNGKWLTQATEFVKSNYAQLKQVPTAFFLVGLMANKKSEVDRKLVEQFLAAERALVKPVAEGRFVGVMFTKNYQGMDGLGMRFFIAYCGLGLRGGDFRDPSAIRAWAESVRPLLIQ